MTIKDRRPKHAPAGAPIYAPTDEPIAPIAPAAPPVETMRTLAPRDFWTAQAEPGDMPDDFVPYEDEDEDEDDDLSDDEDDLSDEDE